MFDFKSASTLG